MSFSKDKQLNKLNGKSWAYWDIFSFFVYEECFGRDESHGHKHMENVAITSIKIFFDIYGTIDGKQELIDNIIAVAWLHDVADHKYDKDGKLKEKVKNFLLGIFEEGRADLIENIIDRISYSKENKSILENKPLDWLKVLGKEGCIIRDIVSDADKLEAIGKTGIKRCIEYTQHNYLNKYHKEIPHFELVITVKKHADEKLLRLKDNFIRTELGKKMAEVLHDELVEELEKL